MSTRQAIRLTMRGLERGRTYSHACPTGELLTLGTNYAPSCTRDTLYRLLRTTREGTHSEYFRESWTAAKRLVELSSC